MERGQRRASQQTRYRQPQRPPQRNLSPHRRKKRRSKRPFIFAASVVVIALIIIISVSVHNAKEDARLTAQIKANADAVTPFSEQVKAAASEQNSNVPFVVYDSNGVKITVTGYDPNGMMGKEIEYIFENNSTVPIMFGVGDAYISGWKITTIGGNTLEPGTKTTGSIYLSEGELIQSGITEISSITIEDCNIWNDESDEIIDTFNISLNLK